MIDAARQRLAGNLRFVFPRRFITRPEGLPGEDYAGITDEVFKTMAADGKFALIWRAHGLSYGISRSIEDDLALGRTVVVNVSRGVITEARKRYPVMVALIAAQPHTLAERLAKRGRETAEQIKDRLSRSAAYQVAGDDVIEIANDGPLERAVAAFLDVLG